MSDRYDSRDTDSMRPKPPACHGTGAVEDCPLGNCPDREWCWLDYANGHREETRVNSYEQHAQHMVEEGIWTPEEAEGWVGNTMYDDWRDFQAELELEAREVAGRPATDD